MLTTDTITTETTYEYNAAGKMIKKTVVEKQNIVVPTVTTTTAHDTGDIETGIELSSTFEMSPMEVFLTAAAGAIVGNLLYRAIRKS